MGLGSDWRGGKLRSLVPGPDREVGAHGRVVPFVLPGSASKHLQFKKAAISRKLPLEDLGHCVVTLLQVQMSLCTSQHLVSSRPS